MQTIHEAAEAIRQQKITPVDLVEECLANIDRWEEKVRAWVFVDRDGALAEAKRLNEELKRGQYRGPLHGIPIGVKDIFDVFDWPTAAGSKLWANSIAREDADVIRQLRQAGCIFLGKTVTTQYASFDPPVTRNPWNLSRTPGGSSSGSAAAVATGMCLGALGSQTGGSITRPASYCGVAGCKPSYGYVSCNGVVPLAHSMDHPGPIAKCVADLEIMLKAMFDLNRVLYTSTSRCTAEYLADVADFGPRLMRLHGLFDNLTDTAVREMVEKVVNQLIEKRAIIADHRELPPSFNDVLAEHRTVMAVEAATYHELRLRRHPEDYQPRIRALLEEGFACPAPRYARAKAHQESLKSDMSRMICDEVLLTPATTSPAPDAATTGNPAFNSPWSYTGLPTVSIPVGLSPDGLPLAIQLVGSIGSDEDLLSAAAWVEKALSVGQLTPPLPR
jgi:aspartyl-tRNA(Asn)/glutamyl-tRNA(Gln) amidotransferase subunit A